MAYEDNQHPPNAHFPGEEPTTGIDIGPAGIKVSLDTWGPQEHLFTTLYDTTTATWGNAPTRSASQSCLFDPKSTRAEWEDHLKGWEHKTGWCRLDPAQQKFLEGAFAGKSLQQDLEGINLWFTIDGVSRAFTHEFVRTRIGAAFKQHGGRDNDWRHRHWTMTESMERMCEADDKRLDDGQRPELIDDKRHPIVNWDAIDRYICSDEECLSSHKVPGLRPHGHPLHRDRIRQRIYEYLKEGKRLYAAMVDAGVAWQDARRVLPIGTQTYVHGIYNYVGLRGAAANRLEFIMDWEINCVFQLMLREIKMKLPPIMSQFLGSHSDIAGKAMFDRLQLCPPDGKYPSTTIRCKTCGHHEANHRRYEHPVDGLMKDEMVCEACERGHHVKSYCAPLHRFIPEDTLPRVFRREQQPFWVLHPSSMAGGPIRWLWTNGHYHDIDAQLQQEV
jgi:thymidylate synthase ThyX